MIGGGAEEWGEELRMSPGRPAFEKTRACKEEQGGGKKGVRRVGGRFDRSYRCSKQWLHYSPRFV